MESGACSCDYDFEPIKMHRTKKRRARKCHMCEECGSEIVVGESYYVHTGFLDGSWFTLKNCAACERIRDDYGCGCIGDLDTVINESLGVWINRE